jgi:L-lactate dehydrogenase complex protein LldG
MNDSRDKVLSAIHNALTESKPPEATFTGYDRRSQPAEIGTEATLLKFAEMLGKVGGEAHILNGEEAAVSILRGIAGDFSGRIVLLPPDSELEKLDLSRMLEETGVKVLQPHRGNLEESGKAAMGVTTAQAGIADTGTVVLLHTAERGRLAALLAPVHVVFLRKAAVYPDKITFLEEARRAGMDFSATPLTWVTGPSLTADIEKVLVRGAHGPGRVVALLY